MFTFLAHEHNVEERNSQCKHISHSLFSKDWNPSSQPAQLTVWLGDLNYRLRGVDSQPARKLIQNDLQRVRTTFIFLTTSRLVYCQGLLVDND